MPNGVCALDENLSHVHKLRARQFLERQASTHTGFERFAVHNPSVSDGSRLSHSADSGVPTLDAQGTRTLSSRPRNSGVTSPAEFVAGRNHEVSNPRLSNLETSLNFRSVESQLRVAIPSHLPSNAPGTPNP